MALASESCGWLFSCTPVGALQDGLAGGRWLLSIRATSLHGPIWEATCAYAHSCDACINAGGFPPFLLG